MSQNGFVEKFYKIKFGMNAKVINLPETTDRINLFFEEQAYFQSWENEKSHADKSEMKKDPTFIPMNLRSHKEQNYLGFDYL